MELLRTYFHGVGFIFPIVHNDSKQLLSDWNLQDYNELSLAYRPSHADATYDMKYGVRAIGVIMSRCHNRYLKMFGFYEDKDFDQVSIKLVITFRVVGDLQQEKPLVELHLELLPRNF